MFTCNVYWSGHNQGITPIIQCSTPLGEEVTDPRRIIQYVMQRVIEEIDWKSEKCRDLRIEFKDHRPARGKVNGGR